jgi:sugar phosphate isomerase/epimerase
MTLDRRTFLTQVTAAGALLSAREAFAQAGPRRIESVGVQLYTARNEMGKDVEGTLAKIAALGYKEVEFAGYFDKSPQAIRDMLMRLGLTSPSTHIDLATITNKLPQTLEASHTIGHRFIVMPYLDDATRAQTDIYKKVADTLNKAGEQAQKAGIQIAYHNHNFEFIPANGTTPFDQMMAAFDPKLVKVELDLCWTTSTKQDPVAIFRKYPGRFPMVHVKGLKKVPAEGALAPIAQVLPDVCDVGAPGDVVDWKAIFAQSSVAGIQHYFVEHDQPANALDSLKNSYAYLQGLRF